MIVSLVREDATTVQAHPRVLLAKRRGLYALELFALALADTTMMALTLIV